MIRPEARAQITRWREALVGGGAISLGLWWLMGPGNLLVLPGAALVATGIALVWIGIQRARFRYAGQGPGAVQVDEGQIVYFGPLTGGAVSIRELARVTLDPTLHPDHWCLTQNGQPDLMIPVNARGAEALFDAFASLPGFRMEHVLQLKKARSTRPVVIWESKPSNTAKLPLH